ncbi:MAG: hypothetical protein K2I93_09000, partial [Oscillospiraceae bacterium]|nr:hypothetical protein [Oscillospiraceae bacterium]
MKRTICMLTALSAALAMTACSSVPEITGTDYTVKAPVTYEVGFFKGNVVEDSFSDAAILYAWAPTKENIVKHADALIEGTVISSVYTSQSDSNEPWTKLDVVVNESYDGELCAGDAISIYYVGGYMPLKEHYALVYADSTVPPDLENAEGMYHFVKSFEETPKAGSTFLFP